MGRPLRDGRLNSDARHNYAASWFGVVVLFLSQYLLGFATLTIVIARVILAVAINWLCQNSINESCAVGLGPSPLTSDAPC